MVTPFNGVAHDFLINAGYSYERNPEYVEDVGDPENGPKLDVYVAGDRYWDDTHCFVIFEDGFAEQYYSTTF
jgi:hypothetical protein